MNNLSKKSESLIGIFIILFSVFISGFLIYKYVLLPSASSKSIDTSVKTEVQLGNINWAEQSRTLVMALQTSCHFCTDSAPFYKRLVEKIKGKNIKLIAVFPTDVKEARAHMDKLGLADIEVKQIEPNAFQVDGTPTLILLDQKGEVINHWIGKLPPEKEAEVVNELVSENLN